MQSNNWRIFTPQALSNEDYHGEMFAGYFSGSDLATVIAKSPAHYKFKDPDAEPSKALAFGTASHACMLEPKVFAEEFYKDVNPSEYEGILTSDAAMKSWLKSHGIAGYSQKKGQQLVDMIRAADQDVFILSELKRKNALENDGKTILSVKDFDTIMSMREQIFNNDQYADALTDGLNEYSIIGDLFIEGEEEPFKVKIRPDIITKNGELWDYKTTRDAHPDDFGRSCFNCHYLLKEALKHDVFEQWQGVAPKRVVLLAQEKSYPFVPQAYALTQAQLEYGRWQYTEALKIMRACQEANAYPAYGNSVRSLQMPAWAKIDD